VHTLRRLWRTLASLDPRLVDGGLAVVLAAGATTQILLEGPQRPLAIVSTLGTGLPLAWRRRQPLGMHLAQIAFAIVGARQPVTITLLATFIGLYSDPGVIRVSVSDQHCLDASRIDASRTEALESSATAINEQSRLTVNEDGTRRGHALGLREGAAASEHQEIETSHIHL